MTQFHFSSSLFSTPKSSHQSLVVAIRQGTEKRHPPFFLMDLNPSPPRFPPDITSSSFIFHAFILTPLESYISRIQERGYTAPLANGHPQNFSGPYSLQMILVPSEKKVDEGHGPPSAAFFSLLHVILTFFISSSYFCRQFSRGRSRRTESSEVSSFNQSGAFSISRPNRF